MVTHLLHLIVNLSAPPYEFFIDVLFAKIKAGRIICAPLSMLSLPKPQLIQA